MAVKTADNAPAQRDWAGELGDGETNVEPGLTVKQFLEKYPGGVFKPALDSLVEEPSE